MTNYEATARVCGLLALFSLPYIFDFDFENLLFLVATGFVLTLAARTAWHLMQQTK